MHIVGVWTGQEATMLKQALRLTNEAFAQRLGTAVRTVAKWSREPDIVPMPELQRALDTVLRQADEEDQHRFGWLLGNGEQDQSAERADFEAAELRLADDPVISQVLGWLDMRAGWPDGGARRIVAELVRQVDLRYVRDRSEARGRVSRQALAEALVRYYKDETSGSSPYGPKIDGQPLVTSILTKAEWLDLRLPFGPSTENAVLSTAIDEPRPLDEHAAKAAAFRLAIAIATGTRFTNSVIYRLLSIDFKQQHLSARVGLTNFSNYAFTLDLLENETLDAISEGWQITPKQLALRAAYLPSKASVLNIEDRICVGGPLALFVAARPAQRRNRPDYAIIVQRRSGRVLNAANRLAVIPKAFHEPLIDYSDEARFSTTIEREMEEELFGRAEVDSTLGDQRHADPMHISRLSQPMRWLIEHSDDDCWRMECTGFGFNLVSGNFEVASLIVVEDESWWATYGGQIETNWEASRLLRYSSLDHDTVGELAHDASWSNEGLFAFLQGLRRLKEIGGARVDLPPIEWELER